MDTIGDRLREARGGLSMAKAAVLVGISQQAWNIYEKNSSAPGAKLILRICQAFNISADWLLGIDRAAPAVSVIGNGNAVANGAGARAVAASSAQPGDLPQCAKCPLKKRLAKIERAMGK